MRRLLSALFLVALFSGLVFPGLYFYYGRHVPAFASREAVRKAVADAVEGERRGTTVVGQRYENVRFELWPVARIPKVLVGGVLAVDGCPDYLATHGERGWPRAQRLLARAITARIGGPPGPGRCQLVYADHIAGLVGIYDPIQAAIAAQRILGALDAEDLLAYRISAGYFAPGIVGVQDAARRLFKKDAEALTPSQVAELLAADGDFTDLLECRNPSKLKLYRDGILYRMEAFRVIDAKEAKAARQRPLTCTLTP